MAALVLNLDGEWQLSGRREPAGASAVPKLENPEFTIPATVPGNIELELFRAGIVADPYIELNARQLRPYEFYEWCYRCEFEYDGEARDMELEFAGADCFCTVLLNGTKIGQMDNALIPHTLSTAGMLRRGSNTLAVHIADANRRARAYPFCVGEVTAYDYNMELLHVRKCAHVWGWDIAPRMALGGLFRHVELREKPAYRLLEHHWSTLIWSAEKPLLRFSYLLALPPDEDCLEPLTLDLTGDCRDSHWEASTVVRTDRGIMAVEIPRPYLWWPRHYGNPDLYRVTARLRRGGEVLAEETFFSGFRKLELKAQPLAGAGAEPDFQFVVNDRPIRVFGFNHVPADALHSCDLGRHERILDMAADLNCNMIRLWGGGIYEPDSFFDRCDREGILVWHDFMMACANYPQDPEFQETLRHEAEDVVRRLRHHPSIALWAGDNECDANALWIRIDPAGNELTRRVLPMVCARHDPERPYLASSPWISPEAMARGRSSGVGPETLTGEQHLWGPRDYFKSDFYRCTNASFVSEIGYHGAPAVSSIRRFIAPEALWPGLDNPQWSYHASNPYWPDSRYLDYRIPLMYNQVKEMFGRIPDVLEDFVPSSQICQAEALKYFLELARGRRKISGMLWWNLIDCWPQFSDAVVDYYFTPKLAYYYLRRLQQPVLCLVTEPDSWHRRILAINDSAADCAGTLRVRDADTDEVWFEGPFAVPAGTDRTLATVKCCTTEQRLLLLEWETADGVRGGNHCLCGNPPFDPVRYRNDWLPRIAALANGFDAQSIGR